MFITNLLNKIFNADQTPNNTVSWSGTNGLKNIQDDIVEEIRARGSVVLSTVPDLSNQGKNNSQSALVQGVGLYTWKPTGIANGNLVVQASDGGYWYLQANISSAGVSKIIAGNNITITPSTGIGDVTIDATGGGGNTNPFALGINLPTPIVNITKGTNVDVHSHNSNFVINGNHGVYDINAIGTPALSVTLPNSRYAQYLTGGTVNSPEFADINALNPKIFMFVYRKKAIGKYPDSAKTNAKHLVKAGSFTHPANIIDGNVAPTYSNFSGGKTTAFGYIYDNYWQLGIGNIRPDLTDANLIQARSEWDVNVSSSYETRVDLLGLNPFRFYTNSHFGTTSAPALKNFNTNEDFFNIGSYAPPSTAYTTFEEFGSVRRRENWSCKRGTSITQAGYNNYLAFALVIQNPLDPTQYIIGPMSKVVKQKLLMGYNSFGNKVPKAFTFMV